MNAPSRCRLSDAADAASFGWGLGVIALSLIGVYGGVCDSDFLGHPLARWESGLACLALGATARMLVTRAWCIRMCALFLVIASAAGVLWGSLFGKRSLDGALLPVAGAVVVAAILGSLYLRPVANARACGKVEVVSSMAGAVLSTALLAGSVLGPVVNPFPDIWATKGSAADPWNAHARWLTVVQPLAEWSGLGDLGSPANLSFLSTRPPNDLATGMGTSLRSGGELVDSLVGLTEWVRGCSAWNGSISTPSSPEDLDAELRRSLLDPIARRHYELLRPAIRAGLTSAHPVHQARALLLVAMLGPHADDLLTEVSALEDSLDAEIRALAVKAHASAGR